MKPQPESTPALSIKTKFFYGSGAAAEAAIHITFNTFNFLFYNNILGLSGTLTGLAITIAVVFDAISDPIVGSISDRWRSKFGRRHPFLYVSAVPLGLCFIALYAPPDFLEEFGLFIWFTVFTIFLRLSLTLYHVPHLALGAELSDDYRERSVVYGYNSVLGMVGGATAYFLAWTYLGQAEGGISDAANFLPIGIIVGSAATALVLMSALFTKDLVPRLKQITTELPPFSLKQLTEEILDCFKNPNYLWLVLGLLCISATNGLREAMNAYVGLFFWELVPNQLRFFGLATPLAFVFAFFATPWLNNRFDKVGTMMGGIGVLVIAQALPPTLRLLGLIPENGHPAIFPMLLVAIAIVYGAGAILSISVLSALADIADEHELNTGRRQEGIFFSARTFVGKATGALGLLIGGIAIDFIGWPTGVKTVDQVDPETIFNLGLIEGPLAAIPSLFAIFFYAKYTITKKRHEEIRKQLAEKNSR
ncbi:MAG: GPH family glycoside/pentoside/hexuronide:cation symporter [Candidatus Azotimanducaceae bacterium]|jgi:GPH family glycoside/pentoside/hexuronide:cation symporter